MADIRLVRLSKWAKRSLERGLAPASGPSDSAERIVPFTKFAPTIRLNL
jgi:hypothetical protein